MPWIRVSDTAAFAPKSMAMGNAAYGALTRLASWAGQQRTDGWLPAEVVRMIASESELKKLLTVKANGRATPLHRPGDECSCLAGREWPAEGGYWVHDFLDQNPSRAENDVHRAKRKELGDRELRRAVKERDGNACRYCGTVALWNAHRGPRALEIDHVDPKMAAGLNNLVIACRSCNARKKDCTPAAAGIEQLPPPVHVPPGGWKPGDEPTIDRRSTDDPTDGTDRDPTDDRTDGPTDDPTDGTDRGTTLPTIGEPTALTSADATAGAESPGTGRGGNTAGSGPGQPTVGPATTPRSALAPNPYFKASTSNPPHSGGSDPDMAAAAARIPNAVPRSRSRSTRRTSIKLPACETCGAAEGAPLSERMVDVPGGAVRPCSCREGGGSRAP